MKHCSHAEAKRKLKDYELIKNFNQKRKRKKKIFPDEKRNQETL